MQRYQCDDCFSLVKKSELKKCQGLEEEWRLACRVKLCSHCANVSREGRVYCNECWRAL